MNELDRMEWAAANIFLAYLILCQIGHNWDYTWLHQGDSRVRHKVVFPKRRRLDIWVNLDIEGIQIYPN